MDREPPQDQPTRRRDIRDLPAARPPEPPPAPRPTSERIPRVARRKTEVSDRTRNLPPAQQLPRDEYAPPRRSQQRRGRRVPRPTEPEDSGLYVPWWGFVLVILAVAGITCGLWAVVMANRGDPAEGIGPTPSPIFVVITSTPTLSASSEDVPAEPGPEQDAAATQDALPPTATPFEADLTSTAVASTGIQLGSTVRIGNTGGSGLAVRQGPGVTYTYFFVGNDGDEFIVDDGPREADGYTWWYLVDPSNPERIGWAAGSFLEVVIP